MTLCFFLQYDTVEISTPTAPDATPDPAPVPDPNPTPDPTPDPAPNPESSKNICETNPNSVACLDVGELTNAPDIQGTDQLIDFSEYSLSSGGGCPAPIAINTKFGNLELSYQPVCDFASMLRPFIIALGGLFAFMIMANSIREGGR
jgi:hypothetical protein